jgi:hypothetical protein
LRIKFVATNRLKIEKIKINIDDIIRLGFKTGWVNPKKTGWVNPKKALFPYLTLPFLYFWKIQKTRRDVGWGSVGM